MGITTEGILNVDKPVGPTSHDVINDIRRLTGVRRVGHTGTLDPLASGVLVVCIGRATRLAEYVVGQPKTYKATIRLGQETTTYDGEGEVVAERPVSITRETFSEALASFRGEITQIPPMHSAVKVGGQPLYRRARQGIEIERPSRQVIIYSLSLRSWDPPFANLDIVCSSGTYIRSIAHDLGQILKCGAYLAGLVRTAVGNFTIANAVPLDGLLPDKWLAHLLPLETAVDCLPRVLLPKEEAMKLYYGQVAECYGDHPDGTIAQAYDIDGQFVGIVEAADRRWQARKIFYQPVM